MPWSDVKLAVLWMHSKTSFPDPNDAVTSRPDAFGITTSAEWLTGASDTKLPLLELLQDFRERNCTDQRDKVYGLLSLAVPDDAQAIRVDYNKSVGEVYADTVLASIRKHKRLTALAFVSHTKKNLEVGIPS
jgi:hypothetical protein